MEIQNKEFVEGFKHYYVIEFLGKSLKARIPRRTLEEIGVRTAMSETKIEDILQVLQDIPEELPGDYRKRRKQVETELYSGSPKKIAKAVRELTWRKEQEGLNTTDRRLLHEGRKMLIKEISLVTSRDAIEVREEIDEALSQAMEAKEQILV